MLEPLVKLADVRRLVSDAYIPFANIERAITWPEVDRRFENDVEHSFSLALVAASVAERLGLDPNKAAALAVVHDLVEVEAGDTPVWDVEALKTKHEREKAALEKMKIDFAAFPWIAATIEEYEELESEEACLVYTLDKLLALIMIVEDGGKFWKDNGITFEAHQQKALELTRHKINRHPTVLALYQEILEQIEAEKDFLFAKPAAQSSV